MTQERRAAIIVVGYRNAFDIAQCVKSLRKADAASIFHFIAENGGEKLSTRICRPESRWRHFHNVEFCNADATFARTATFSWTLRPFDLNLAKMRENFGYAGEINVWIDHLIDNDVWMGSGFSTRTFPAPDALENSCLCRNQRVGMVGSRL